MKHIVADIQNKLPKLSPAYELKPDHSYLLVIDASGLDEIKLFHILGNLHKLAVKLEGLKIDLSFLVSGLGTQGEVDNIEVYMDKGGNWVNLTHNDPEDPTKAH